MVQRIRVFFTGLICGSAVGAGLAFILAPDTGESFRHMTRERWQAALQASHQASQARRQVLLAELQQKTSLPPTEQK